MNRKIDPQLILSLGVLLISLAAVYVSVRQANIMNKQTDILLEQTKASAWPSLSLDLRRSFVEDRIDAYKISISNKGTGPAIIKGVRVAYDGKSVKKWGELYDLSGIPNTIEQVHSNSGISNRVFATGDIITMLNLSENKPLMEWIFKHGHKIEIEICYESVYGDAFLVKKAGFQSNREVSITQKSEGCNYNAADLFLE